MFPDEYVSNISERIRLYKELNEIATEEALLLFEKKLLDRFGALPPAASALLDIVRIKWIAVKLGIEKILLKNNLLIANFISDPGSQYYRSSLFVSVMAEHTAQARRVRRGVAGERLRQHRWWLLRHDARAHPRNRGRGGEHLAPQDSPRSRRSSGYRGSSRSTSPTTRSSSTSANAPTSPARRHSHA